MSTEILDLEVVWREDSISWLAKTLRTKHEELTYLLIVNAMVTQCTGSHNGASPPTSQYQGKVPVQACALKLPNRFASN